MLFVKETNTTRTRQGSTECVLQIPFCRGPAGVVCNLFAESGADYSAQQMEYKSVCIRRRTDSERNSL